MSVRIFNKQEHQDQFDKEGFICLPFLRPEEIDLLDCYFDELHPNLAENGFFSGSYSSDFAYKKKASDKIVEVFSRAYAEIFVDYTPFGGAFLYKTPGESSELAAHQDWTIVDEENALALNCWVPLCDVNLDNGPIMVLPGSQYPKHPVLRAPTLPFFFSGNDDLIVEELEPMTVKAGTAVILNQSVIHYSPANTSNAVRKAITAGVKSKGDQMRFHYKLPEQDKLEVFEEEDDFLLRFDNFLEDIGQRPKMGTPIGFIDYTLPKYDRESLYYKIKALKEAAGYPMKTKATAEGNKQEVEPSNASLLAKLKSWWKS